MPLVSGVARFPLSAPSWGNRTKERGHASARLAKKSSESPLLYSCMHSLYMSRVFVVLPPGMNATQMKLLQTDNDATTVLIRLIVGLVFLSEGIQKFLFPALRGAGRFEKIGLPSPEFLGSFVGSFEVICGLLIVLGLFTRLAAVPLLVIMLVAIATTKAETLAKNGFWEMMHGSRTDWAMLLGSIFLIIKGGGKWSIDKRISGK